ncbi:MAG: sensor histidine kinase, partial [Myxococcota bacterium]
MQDVSPLALAVFRAVAAEVHCSVEALYDGVADVTVAEKNGLDWARFCRVTERLMHRCGGPAALAVQGALAMKVPELGPTIQVLRMFGGTRELYWSNVRWGGPSLFRVITTQFRVLPNGRYLAILDIRDGLESSEGFFQICAGVFTALPRAFGLPDAQVRLTVTGRRGTYLIDPPPAPGFFARLWNLFTTLFSSHEIIERLAAQNEHLVVMSRDAARARADAEAARARAEAALAVAEEQRLAAEAARAEALAALELKSQFVGTVSHELRTPLNGILGMTHLLAATRLDAEQRDCVDTITSSGGVLLELINDLLDFSKIQAAGLVLDPTATELRGLVETVCVAAASRVAERPVEVIAIVRPEVPQEVLVDGFRLRQVLSNLLDNAVKFTQLGEVVLEIGPGATEGRLRCAVRDTGIGISPAERERIFQPFVQADGSTTRKYGGTGLGLTISSKIVAALGGDIALESTPGVGSTFAFEFDAATITPAAPPPADAGSVTVVASPSQRAALDAMLASLGWRSVDEGAAVAIVDETADHDAVPACVRRVGLVRPGVSCEPGRTLRKPVRLAELRDLLARLHRAEPPPVRPRALVFGGDEIQRRVLGRVLVRLGWQPAGDDAPDLVLVPWPSEAGDADPLRAARERWKSSRAS